jgi:hypothetical protein
MGWGDRAGEALVLNNLGFASQALSRYEQTLAYYEQARTLLRERERRAGEGTVLQGLSGEHQWHLCAWCPYKPASDRAVLVDRRAGIG